IYYMAMDTLDYDTDKANEASSGGLTDFIPDLDDAISTGKGICFDYASLMVAMLRIQELPAKLVIGYAGEVYHAWINVYTEEYGWIDEVITFDGTEWTLMDPTFADNTESKSALNDFIGDGTNYTEKYVY
ncbi:MAG: transglutaminase-like domain-containing protein, partial [Eubacteriales bacterium]